MGQVIYVDFPEHRDLDIIDMLNLSAIQHTDINRALDEIYEFTSRGRKATSVKKR